MRVWDEDADFETLVLSDPDIKSHLTQGEVQQVFNIENTLKYIDTVFERVFGSS